MRKYLATGCLAVVALAALGSSGCCCQRKGIVLRGDWSLEFNRVPHMCSHGPKYSGDACTEPCENYTCTSGSCDDGSCPSCRNGRRAGGSSGGMMGEYYEQMPGGSSGGAGGYDGGSSAPPPPPPQPTPAAQSRFHPVPTRPVFEPQQSVAAVPYNPPPYDAGLNSAGPESSRRSAGERRAQDRPATPSAAPRSSGRVATQASVAPMPRRELEPALFEPDDGASEVLRATNEEVATAPEESAGEPIAHYASPTTSVWRVKTRRS